MGIEREITALIDLTFEGTEWEDLLSDTFATLGGYYDQQTEIDEARSDLDTLRGRFEELKESMENFHQSEQYLQQAWRTLSDRLEDDVHRISGEVARVITKLDTIKTRKPLLDYLIFWR